MEKYLSKNWVCCGIIGLFTLLVWGQTVRFGFVWDDSIYIFQNKSILSTRNIPAFFLDKGAQSAEAAPVSYRPVRNTVYALLRVLGGKGAPQSWIYHLANLLWHGAAAALLFLVMLLLWERLAGGVTAAIGLAALLTALGFAAHPANTEAVCWAKCMDDLMAGVFVLAAARSLLKWNGGRRGYAAALGWFLLAAFTKESAAPFAAAVFFVFHGFHRMPWRRSLRLALPFFLAAGFYVVCRRAVMGRSSQCPPLSGSYGQTLVDMCPVAAEYLRLLSGIPPFCADYNYMVGAPPHSFFSAAVLGGVIVVALAGGLAFWLWRSTSWRLTAFGLAWTGLFLLPVSNLVPMMQFMADRFLYLPLMGFLAALAGACLNFSRPRAVASAAAGVVGIWMGLSLDRMGIWHDDLTLWMQTEQEHPGIRRVGENAAAAILRLPEMRVLFPDENGGGPAEEALSPARAEAIIATLQEARRLFPENEQFTTELAFVEAKTGHWREAEALAELAVRQNPGSAKSFFNLASVYLGAGNPAKAAEACAQALRLQPDFAKARTLQQAIEKARHGDGAGGIPPQK